MALPVITPLEPAHRTAWQRLAAGYKAFYNTPTTEAEYDEAWRRLLARDGVHGLGATLHGELVGFSHHLFHTSTWAPTVCYLQDLFTAPAARGHGVATALIEAVADAARGAGCGRFYWLTQQGNATARSLYDRVARFKGFIRYDFDLSA
jgi:GNAT superfamily N-acetyltransferase